MSQWGGDLGCKKVGSWSLYCRGHWRPVLFPPSALCRQRTDWSATVRPSTFQASVGFIPAEPQLVSYRQAIHLSGFRRVYPGGASRLVRYRQAIHLSGFRRVYPGGATTGRLPSGNPPFRLPSGSSRRSHNWSATVRPSSLQASVGFIPAEPQLVSYAHTMHIFGRVLNVPSHRHAFETESSRGMFRPCGRVAVASSHPRLGRHGLRLLCSSRPVRTPPGLEECAEHK